mgnify:FL=1|tara:strand:- start:6642 stop:6830 length:189 start_codon:yes stop_codon:yes gene_type:complete
MDDDKVKLRMIELRRPIDKAIMMCDSNEEILMLASVMQIALKDIYDTQIGIEGRKTMFREAS